MVTRWPSTGPATVSSIELSGFRPQFRWRYSISPLPRPIPAQRAPQGPASLEQAMITQQPMMKDALSPHTSSPLPADENGTVTGTDIVYLADLEPQPVKWPRQHRLAAGTLAMLSGEPGSGKTWVALAIAAALTRGCDPFTGVLYASAEHPAQSFNLASPASTEIPRAKAQVCRPMDARLPATWQPDPGALSRYPPSAMVSALPPCTVPNSISAFVAPKTKNQMPGGGICRLRRIITLRSTRQDAQLIT
jgi:hypothetical protein